MTNTSGLHPIVVDSERASKAAGYNSRSNTKCLSIKAPKESFERALRIMSVLIYALERVGCGIGFKKLYPNDNSQEHFSCVTYQDVSIRIYLSPSEGNKSLEGIDGAPLEVRLNHDLTHSRKWKDLPRTPLEGRAESIAISILAVLKKLHIKKREVDEAEEIRKLQHQAFNENLKRRQAEKQMTASLINEAESWEKASLIRRYIKAVEGHLKTRKLSAEEYETLASWIIESRRRANSLDPITGKWIGKYNPSFSQM